jgi:hypothetical protein
MMRKLDTKAVVDEVASRNLARCGFGETEETGKRRRACGERQQEQPIPKRSTESKRANYLSQRRMRRWQL